MKKSRVCQLLDIEYPIFQGGMAWIADASLAAAVSEAGGLGIITGTAPTDWVRDEIRKAKKLTDNPFGVNIMLMDVHADEIAKMVCEEGVKVVTTGAGSPGKYMEMWKAHGVKVIPVVASVALAKRMEKAGADHSKVTTVDVGTEDFFIATKNNLDFEWTFEGWTNISAKLRNFDINYIPLRELDERLDYYTPIIASSESTLNEKSDMVKKFMEATSKGYEFAINNPEESAEILVKEVPEIDKDLAVESQKFLAKEYKSDANRWGEMKDSVWDNYTQFMLEYKLINKDMKASEAYTNEFLPE